MDNLVKIDHLIDNFELLKDDIAAKVHALEKLHEQLKETVDLLKGDQDAS